MVGFRQLEKELAGDEWNLGKLGGLSADDFLAFSQDGHKEI